MMTIVMWRRWGAPGNIMAMNHMKMASTITAIITRLGIAGMIVVNIVSAAAAVVSDFGRWAIAIWTSWINLYAVCSLASRT